MLYSFMCVIVCVDVCHGRSNCLRTHTPLHTLSIFTLTQLLIMRAKVPLVCNSHSPHHF